MSGFIVIDRKIKNWEWFDDQNMFTVWMHILIDANWRAKSWHGHAIDRGSFFTSYTNFAKECGMPSSTVRRCLDRLETAGQISRKRHADGTLITVMKYSDFQDIRNTSGTETAGRRQETGTQTAGRRQASEQQQNHITNITNKPYSRQAEPPTWEEVESFAYAIGYIDPLPFYRQMENSGWTYKGEPVKDWRRLLKGFKRQQDMDRSKSMASHQRQTEHLPEYMKQPQPEPEGTDPELMAELLEWQRKNGGQT